MRKLLRISKWRKNHAVTGNLSEGWSYTYHNQKPFVVYVVWNYVYQGPNELYTTQHTTFIYYMQDRFLDAFVLTVHKSVHDSKRKKYSEGIDGLAQLQWPQI